MPPRIPLSEMDPISFGTSLIAVLELTVTLMKYVNDVRNAPKERAQLAREASNVYALLTSLRFRVEDAKGDDPWFSQIKLLASENGALSQFRTILEKLVTRLDPSSKLKDLLWKFNKPEIEEALAQIERLKSLINLALANDLFALAQSIKNDVAGVAQDLETLRLEHEGEWPSKLSTWLDVPDPSSNYAAACKRRQEGTGSWLLDDKRFLNWQASPGSSLWLHGIPGCGKTILSATVVDQIRKQPQIKVAYFYFDFNEEDKKKVSKCIRSLIVQLAGQVPGGIQEIRALHAKCRDGQLQPQDTALMTALSRLIQKSDKVYIIFDALDECEDYQELLDLIENFIQRHQNCLHLLATSRRERELEERLQPLITEEVPIQAASVDADINMYVEDLLKNDSRLRKWPTDVRNEIRRTIAEKANGMFRWAYCQIDSLRKCIKLSALRQMLSTLPKTLDETYERILSTIEANGQLDDAVRVLQWLCFAKRPQSLKSLVDILATDVGGNGCFLAEERLPDPLDIITICSSLITVREETHSENIRVLQDPEDPIIQLAHFSVQEYLLSNRCFLAEQFVAHRGHAVLAEISLIYTLHVCAESLPGDSQKLDVPNESAPIRSLGRSMRREDRTLSFVYEQYPLCRYACAWWYKHAVELPETSLSSRVVELIIRLFGNDDSTLEQWLKFHNPNPFSWSKGRFKNAYFTGFRHPSRKNADTESKVSRIASPLFYAAATGLPRVVEVLIARGHDVNQINDIYPTPLHVAVLKGDLVTAKSILNNGGNVDQQHAKAGRPLQIACASGNNLDMVKLLLTAGASLSQPASDFTFVNPYTGYLTQMHGTALHAACYGGSLAVLKTLLDAGENLGSPISPNSVIRAVGAGFQQAIYEQPAPPNTTPAHQDQSAGPHSNIWSSIELKLQEGQRLTERAGFSRDHIEIVRLLISHGLEANETPWDQYDHTEFVSALLDAGVTADAPDESGDSLLHRALHDNQPELFQKFLQHGADLDALDCYGRSCLDYAGNFPEILERFQIAHDASAITDDEARKDKLYGTALRSIYKILHSDQWPEQAYPALRQLAHCLMYLERLDEAVTVYQMTIFALTEPQTGFRHRALCDGCDADCPETTLRVCRTCRDVDLCEPCFQNYQPGLWRKIHLCRGHEFLEVPLVPFDVDYTQFLPRLTDKIADWLLGLQGKLLQEVPEDMAAPFIENKSENRVDVEGHLSFDGIPPSFSTNAKAARIDIEEYVDLDEFT
ncbi:hypothetical protein H2200_013087 [Cladophialophora chaetospira]|uniref:Ankyrin repeat protein n=1 Tax=Cladophialophora chaetospira TaxID=386627 RepID=A0AA38WWQ7_9EURO|nr:hypothetical protein H2200_013087 [Cladophialophora chaetospira]